MAITFFLPDIYIKVFHVPKTKNKYVAFSVAIKLEIAHLNIPVPKSE